MQKNILIIDDDEETTLLLKFLLSNREGHVVTVIKDGYAAQDFIEKNFPPDVVIMEVMLPYVSGLHLLETMRATPTWADTKIILLTTKSGEKIVEEAFNLNADDFIAKPFRTTDLITRINHQLKSVDSSLQPEAKKHLPPAAGKTIELPLAITTNTDVFFGMTLHPNTSQTLNKYTINFAIKSNKACSEKTENAEVSRNKRTIRFNY